jgi:hypothetical protein
VYVSIISPSGHYYLQYPHREHAPTSHSCRDGHRRTLTKEKANLISQTGLY